jgi:uncharacterized protein YprB with RNaseH-like and TPR domain
VRADLTVADLSRIIRRIEDKHRARGHAPPSASLEEILGGATEEIDGARVFVVRRRFELGHLHGRTPLGGGCEPPLDALGLLARSDLPRLMSPNLLYLDTETTGLAGGTGTYAFLVGLGFFADAAFEVRQYFLRDLDEEPALLAALEREFKRFDGVVTYNGSGFDLPLLETRFVLGRRRFPDGMPHLDLLAPARRLWSARLGDCRLGTIEQHVLRFNRSHDLPGAVIPSVYFEYLRRKRVDELPRVFDHNRHDILSLAALLGWVLAAVARAPAPDLHPEELLGLGRLLEARDVERSVACYRMALDRGLASPSRERLLLRLAAAEKRRTRWDAACALWEDAIGATPGFDPRPWEEIAKVHEHRRRDLVSARAVVETAIARAQGEGISAGVLGAFQHRLARITRRLQGEDNAPSASSHAARAREATAPGDCPSAGAQTWPPHSPCAMSRA